MQRTTLTLTQRIQTGTISVFFITSMVAALFFTRRNLRLGRGDKKGAARLGTFLFASMMLQFLAGSHHVPAFDIEIGSVFNALGVGIVLGLLSGMLYIAIEPFLRRRIPELLIGWARLLEGRFRDARVGRDLLVGGVIGTLGALLTHLVNALPTWIPILGQTTVPPDPDIIEGGGRLLHSLLQLSSDAVVRGLSLVCVLFLHLVLRRMTAATIGVMVLFSLAGLGAEKSPSRPHSRW